MTNATKATLISFVNAVLGLLISSGVVHLSASRESTILIGTNIALGSAAFATRKLSPRWNHALDISLKDATELIKLISEMNKTSVPPASVPGAAPPKKP